MAFAAVMSFCSLSANANRSLRLQNGIGTKAR